MNVDTIVPGEPVRLVVWDLDDTLWNGTLGEDGEVEHIEAHYEIIRTLANRGIVSSICSKNDRQSVEALLTEQRIWDYFLFPSICWDAKGPRLAEQIAAMQLRPSSVLFIDDHPGNRAEALAHAPGIQVADEAFISKLLDDPRLEGRPDPDLERLGHYKILERRRDGLSGGDITDIDFLRDSGIRVSFEYDVNTHVDRAVELINRTNQLNFTKSRLPEEPDRARDELRALIARYDVKAALIRVEDRYGDYGYCGLYVYEGANDWAKLLHFTFSCRVLGMGVERWVHDRLGRPSLMIVPPVRADLFQDGEVDWISPAGAAEADVSGNREMARRIGPVRLRGGCDLDGIGHYFSVLTRDMLVETNYVREHLFFRRDCSTNLLAADRCAAVGATRAGLGEDLKDYETRIFDPIADDGLIILSLCGDAEVSHYRNVIDGALVAGNLHNLWEDGVTISDGAVEERFAEGLFCEQNRGKIGTYLEALKRDYAFYGNLTTPDIALNTAEIFTRLPGNAQIYVLLPSEVMTIDDRQEPFAAAKAYNDVVSTLADAFSHIRLVKVDDFVGNSAERQRGFTHFDRIVYFKIHEHILQVYRETERTKVSDTV